MHLTVNARDCPMPRSHFLGHRSQRLLLLGPARPLCRWITVRRPPLVGNIEPRPKPRQQIHTRPSTSVRPDHETPPAASHHRVHLRPLSFAQPPHSVNTTSCTPRLLSVSMRVHVTKAYANPPVICHTPRPSRWFFALWRSRDSFDASCRKKVTLQILPSQRVTFHPNGQRGTRRRYI